MVSGDVPRTNVLEIADVIRIVRDYHTGGSILLLQSRDRRWSMVIAYSILFPRPGGSKLCLNMASLDHCRFDDAEANRPVETGY